MSISGYSGISKEDIWNIVEKSKDELIALPNKLFSGMETPQNLYEYDQSYKTPNNSKVTPVEILFDTFFQNLSPFITSGGNSQSGYSGYSGYSGTNGQDGIIGVDGQSGYSGYSGIGQSGYSGQNGSIGVNGQSGYSGYSGIGVSGYSGYSGQIGTPGDKYTTSSTTSLTINTGTQSLTVGTGLALSLNQTLLISYDSSHYMIGNVTSYNSSSGALVVNVTSITGTGTFSSWAVSLNGAPGPAGTSGYSGYSGTNGLLNQYYTLNTGGGTYTNYWFPICTIDMTTQFSLASSLILISSFGQSDNSGSDENGTLYLRVKQQAAMGSAP